jgi:hypothetical protein
MKKILTAMILLFFAQIYIFAQNNTDPLSLLKSDDYANRKEGIALLKQKRTESINNLIAILNGNFSLDVKDCAAIALGNCRASEAVDTLIQNIGLDVRGRAIKGFPTEEEMSPVSTSLQKIGSPSVPAIIKLLEEKGRFLESGGTLEERRNAEMSVLLLNTLCRIDGDKDVVKLRLQKALSLETDPQKQARLQSGLKALDKTILTKP